MHLRRRLLFFRIFLQIRKTQRTIHTHRLGISLHQFGGKQLRQQPEWRQGFLSRNCHIRFDSGDVIHQ